jgi:hypothetical protein
MDVIWWQLFQFADFVEPYRHISLMQFFFDFWIVISWFWLLGVAKLRIYFMLMYEVLIIEIMDVKHM